MLLDFNLTQNLNVAKRPGSGHARLQAVAYIAPEHLRALPHATPGWPGASIASESTRSAIVLYEMLGWGGGVVRSPGRPERRWFSHSCPVKAMAVERGQSVPSMRAQPPEYRGAWRAYAQQCLASERRRWGGGIGLGL